MTSETLVQPVSTSASTNTSTLAIVSLIFGILTWVAIPLVGALVAIICGRLAIREINASQGRVIGANYAKAGMLLSRIQVVVVFVYAAVVALRMTTTHL